jgi:uncharacterized membrane protein
MKTLAIDSKIVLHISTIPVTEATGIYSSIKMISDGNGLSKASGIANVSLLALNAGLGPFIAFGNSSNYGKLRMIHRIVGFTVIGTGLWMSIAASTDDKVQSHVKYVSGAYTAMTVVPLVIFNF